MTNKRIEWCGQEMTGCAPLLVPVFIWRLIGANISTLADPLDSLRAKRQAFTQAMDIAEINQLAVEEKIARHNELRD